jgi:hypothetical protein
MAVGPQGKVIFVGTAETKLYAVTVDAASGVAGGVSEFALAIAMKQPNGVCFGRDRTLYVAENNRVLSFPRLIQIALDGLRELQEKSPEELRQWVSRQPLLPSTVPVGRDRSVPITSEGYSALKKLGRTWHANDATRLRLLSRTAAEELAVYAFGDLLSAAGDLPAAADAKSELLRGMDKRFQARTQPEHFYFPARVFDQPEVQTFAIGPVTFYRRVEWLDAVETLAGAPCSWKAEVLDRWTNRQSRLRHILNSLGEWFTGKILKHWPGRSLAHKLLRLRTHRSYVDDILKAVGACEWVMAVAVEGRERSRLSECAFVARAGRAG